MPTSTFFRLPEQKRKRLLDAALEEFTRTNYSKASINRIIHRACIPRGSFYQYFCDKEDLFRYVLNEPRSGILHALSEHLKQAEGDLFAATLCFYQDLIQMLNQPDPKWKHYLEILRINPELSMHNFLVNSSSEGFSPLLGQIDTRKFRDQSAEFVQRILFLLCSLVMWSFLFTAIEPEQQDHHRQNLMADLEVLKYGCLTSAPTFS